jgi:hypothetical protein
MIWLLITSFYSSILIFISCNARGLAPNNKLVISQQTAKFCGGIGLISLILTGILWATLYGWQYGLLALVGSAIANFSLLFMTKNRLSEIVAGATLLIGGSFLATTIKMVALTA